MSSLIITLKKYDPRSFSHVLPEDFPFTTKRREGPEDNDKRVARFLGEINNCRIRAYHLVFEVSDDLPWEVDDITSVVKKITGLKVCGYHLHKEPIRLNLNIPSDGIGAIKNIPLFDGMQHPLAMPIAVVIFPDESLEAMVFPLADRWNNMPFQNLVEKQIFGAAL